MDRYFFPALFDPCEEGGYTVTFPDLPGCITEGNDMTESFAMAKEALELFLWNMEDDNDVIPTPSNPESITIEQGCILTLIEAYMPIIRDVMANKVVKKTLTIPHWLNKIAEEKKVNFSQILQNALKEYLDLKTYNKVN